jgi:hypothetical protein
MKRCKGCGIEKDFDQFSIDRKAKDERKGKCKDCMALYRLENKDKILEGKKKERQKYKGRINATKRKYETKKRKEDPSWKLMKNIRHRIYKSVRDKTEKSKDLLGISIEAYRSYLDFKMEEWMNWDNYGTDWEIDHIKPVAAFNLEIKEERMACFNWENTQPLKKSENLKKHAKYEAETSVPIV